MAGYRLVERCWLRGRNVKSVSIEQAIDLLQTLADTLKRCSHALSARGSQNVRDLLIATVRHLNVEWKVRHRDTELAKLGVKDRHRASSWR